MNKPSPNIFGPPIVFTEREGEIIEQYKKDPVLHRLLCYFLRSEYEDLLARNAVTMDTEELAMRHAYIRGCYAMAMNIIPDLSAIPEDSQSTQL